jgi:hypothetical protein
VITRAVGPPTASRPTTCDSRSSTAIAS